MTSMRLILRSSKFSLRRLTTYTRCSVNINKVELVPVSHFKPKALMILSTPNLLSDVIDQTIKINQTYGIQVVVAGIDTVVPNSSRSGVSEFWSSEHIVIDDATPLETSEVDDAKLKEHEEEENTLPDKNWKSPRSSLKMKFSQGPEISLQLANTVFTQGRLTTLYYIQPEGSGDSMSGNLLSSLSLTIPPIGTQHFKVEVHDNWTPLYDYKVQQLKITNCVGNLIKLINGHSAAKFLEDNDLLTNIGSKDTEVYVKVKRNEHDTPRRYKVIAGGGGWGSKANILALSPEAKISKGDSIEFYMLEPTKRIQENSSHSVEKIKSKSIMFECSYEEQTYNQDVELNERVFEDLFGAGCENGFKFNDVQHESAGERLTISP